MKWMVNKYTVLLMPSSYGCVNGQEWPTIWEKLIIWKKNTKKERKKKVTRNKVDMERRKIKKKLSLVSHRDQKRCCTHERKTGCYNNRRPPRNERWALETKNMTE